MSASSAHPGIGAEGHRRLIERTALTTGAVFAIVGILGFIPGITTNYSQLGVAGHDSAALLLGVFQISILHNAVHVLFGAVGFLMGRTATLARYYLIGGGVIYLVLWVYGLLIDQGSTANFIPVNTADNWLHAGLGAGMVILGFILGRNVREVSHSHQP